MPRSGRDRMVKSFAGQTAVITGGSSGLGLAVARTFLKQDATICLMARNHATLAAVADELRREIAVCRRGTPSIGRVETVAVDITCDEQVEAAFAEVRATCGSIDILINAAGISHRAAILDTTPEQFQSLWELNFLGTVRCMRAAAADLLQARGHLVNIGSLASKFAAAYLGAILPVSLQLPPTRNSCVWSWGLWGCTSCWCVRVRCNGTTRDTATTFRRRDCRQRCAAQAVGRVSRQSIRWYWGAASSRHACGDKPSW